MRTYESILNGEIPQVSVSNNPEKGFTCLVLRMDAINSSDTSHQITIHLHSIEDVEVFKGRVIKSLENVHTFKGGD